LSEDTQSAGVVASSLLHAIVLAFILYGFASAPQFDDASESIAVDTVTKDQFDQVMKGERPAPAAPAATAPAKPEPPTPPEPPPELRKAEETPPPPPPRPEPPPPPRPEPTHAEPPPPPQKPLTPPEPPRPEPTRAEPPAPPQKPPLPPSPPPKPETLETPPPKPKILEMPPERPKEAATERTKPDQLAKLIARDKSEESAKDAKPTGKPYDPKAIAKLLGESKPATTPSGAQANAGAPSGHAPRMSGSQERALDEWFKDAYMACWSPPPTMPEGDPYIPEIQVQFNADGSLSGQPVLVNPPSDPAWRAHAESAMRAALRCNPLKVPSQYAPFFDQWRSKTIHFDPREALG
jgi:hypothetical protein